MKRFFLMTAILTSAVFLLSSFSLRENPQDPPRGKKKERHISLVKMDDKGNKMVLDTILTNDDVFVWNGDTIGGGQMKWFSEGHFDLDSLSGDFEFDFDVTDDGNGNVFMLKSGKNAPAIYEFKTDGEGDSIKQYRIEVRKEGPHGDHEVMVWNGKKGENRVFVTPDIPGVPPVPPVPGLHFIEKGDLDNVIDLSDPGIISYKKKKMSKGREKITIIRNEPDKTDNKNIEEIIIDSKGNHSATWNVAPKVHKVIVTKTDDGKTEVLTGDDVFHLDEGDGTVKVIKEDGKVIRIKEIKEGDEKNIKVEVEVEESEENN